MTLSGWNKDASSTSKKIFLSPRESINFQIYNQTTANYDGITDLTLFPALISKGTAEKILHITNDTDWQAILKAKQLTAITADGAYVTNASLSALIGASPKPTKQADTAKPTDNVGEVKPTDQAKPPAETPAATTTKPGTNPAPAHKTPVAKTN
jgi:hypothetical protein